MSFHLTEYVLLTLQAGSGLIVGMLIGAFHFLTLRTSARMLATGSSLPAALALHLIRFAITGVALTFIARHGALPLLAALGHRFGAASVTRGEWSARRRPCAWGIGNPAAAPTRCYGSGLRVAGPRAAAHENLSDRPRG